jgi:ATP-dependent DNA helicase RecG
MNAQLQKWLEEGESKRVEFKLSFGQDAIETLTAFANTEGGVVLIGVSDAKEIKGVDISAESVNKWVNDVKMKTAPQLIPDAGIINVEGKTVVYLGMAAYPVKPVACRGRCYKRVANTNHILSTQEIVNIHLQSINSSWDFYIRPNKKIADISLEKVNKQIEKINKRKLVPIENPLTFLKKYNLIDGEQITNACWLLFLPEQETTTTIELGHFASETVIKDSVTLKSDLFTEVEQVMEFIRKHISKELIITDTQVENIERWEYPLDAIRELVLNMIVHRNYTLPYDSVIKIFKDRIQFYNPGSLPDSISIQQLLTDDYVSQPYNKQVAEIFKEAGLIEKYGSGIKRVREEFTGYGLPEPTFKKALDGVIVTAFGTNYMKKLVADDTENVTDDTEKIQNVTDVTEKVTEKTAGKVTEKSIKAKKLTETEELTESGRVTGKVIGKVTEKLQNVTDDTENVTEKLANDTENVTDVTENDTENFGNDTENVTDVTENDTENLTNVTENLANVTENFGNVTENVTDDVTDKCHRILEIIIANNQISTQKIAEEMSVTRRTVSRHIELLKEKKLLERIGPDKGGYWKINEEKIRSKSKKK